MKKLAFLSTLLICLSAKPQLVVWSPDSISRSDPNYAMQRYHDILRYHDPLMYLAFPIIKPLAKRRAPLVDGEGKNGYWIEGNLAYRFTVYQGKYYSYSFFQRMRLSFDVGLMPRLTSDESSPLLPSNNKFGFGLDFLLSSLRQLKKENATVLWTTFQVHHYSNGQADSFFIEGPVQRNNYRNGDFSTNYWRTLLNVAGSSHQKSIVSGAVGFQRDFDMRGPLARSVELKQYYGDKRMLISFQWTQKPMLTTVNYQNRATVAADTIKLQKRKQFGFRTEAEYILGDLSRFDGENKRRFGWHTYLTYMPSVTNEVGFMVHTFMGRDYLNIRFDDAVFIGELGVYVKFNGK